MSALTRLLRKKRENQSQNPEPQSQLYKVVHNIAIFGTFTAIAIIVLAIFGLLKLSTFIFGLTATIVIVSVGCLMILPWLKIFEKGQNKKIAIVFMCFVIVCTVLWLICLYLGIYIYESIKSQTANKETLIYTLKLIKITLIISLQFIVTSLVASTIIKYKKEMLLFQIITYISNLFFDLYLTCFLLCITISSEKGLIISENISFLFNKVVLALFALSVIYMALSSKIMQNVEEKRFKTAMDENYDMYGEQINHTEILKEQKAPQNTIEARLEKLQSMLDKKLITQEEFDEKRKEIIKDL